MDVSLLGFVQVIVPLQATFKASEVLDPVQIVLLPVMAIVGATGGSFTTTVTEGSLETALVQGAVPLTVHLALYVPAIEVIRLDPSTVVASGFVQVMVPGQVSGTLKVVLEGEQIVKLPDIEIVGAEGGAIMLKVLV
mgnify:FL=1